MPIRIDDETKEKLRTILSQLKGEVKLRFFKPKGECRFCDDTEYILDIISSLTDKVRVEVGWEGSPEAEKYKLPMYPALLVHGERDYNIRFFGIPAGYEFGALIEDIVDVSRGRTSVNLVVEKVVRERIRKPVRIMVFVTPTCPYCPLAVRAAHKLALISPLVTGDMIEAMEFTELADRYNVFSVPKNVIQVDGKDVLEYEGAGPDAFLVAKVLEALGEEVPSELTNILY